MPPGASTVRAVAASLAADAVAAETVRAFSGEGVRAILLKGPVVERALYGHGEVRSYGDADLLVSSADEARAGDVLRRLGFRPLVDDESLRGQRPLHAREWARSDGASVDLHRTLAGAQARPDQVWLALAARTETVSVGGERVHALRRDALALVLSLHAAHHGPGARRGIAELRRALERFGEADWRGAAQLATEIDALGAFRAGLRALPEGHRLAEQLCPQAQTPVHVVLHAAGAPPLAAGIDWLARTPGTAAKGALLARTLLPAPGALRLWRPSARRGNVALATAYLTHAFWLAWYVLPSLRALRRARRVAA